MSRALLQLLGVLAAGALIGAGVAELAARGGAPVAVPAAQTTPASTASTAAVPPPCRATPRADGVECSTASSVLRFADVGSGLRIGERTFTVRGVRHARVGDVQRLGLELRLTGAGADVAERPEVYLRVGTEQLEPAEERRTEADERAIALRFDLPADLAARTRGTTADLGIVTGADLAGRPIVGVVRIPLPDAPPPRTA